MNLLKNESNNCSALDCLLTFDVEEYFHIESARGVVSRENWSGYESRVEYATMWLLEALEEAHTKATFFVLGWIAREHPKLVRRIAEAGHEIACHGDMHDRLHRLNVFTFREDLIRSKSTLEQTTGQLVMGYRAPTFSVVKETAWAVDQLIEMGFLYDSSIQPIRHPRYGVADAPQSPYYLEGSSGDYLLEIPPLSLQAGRVRLPVAGGGYFRLFPLAMMNAGIKQARAWGHPAMLYFHPWEFDPDQPRLPLKGLNRFRTYVGLSRTRKRLQRVMNEWRCGRVIDWVGSDESEVEQVYQLAA